MAIFSTYCIVGSLVSIVLNCFFLIVTHLRRVEGFQEVLIFMQNISIGYILMSLCLLAIIPQSVTLGSANIIIPYGLLDTFEPNFLNIIASFGVGCYLYTVLCFCILFFYRYNVTCKTSVLSSIFSRRNIAVFLAAAIIFSLIQAVLLNYSSVDSQYLRERLNRTRDLREDLTNDLMATQVQTISVQGNSNSNKNNAAHPTTPNENANPNIPISGINGQTSYSQTSQRIINVFGTDYQRNPMIFLSLGIFAVSTILAFIGTILSSVIVICKLHETENYGKESMSDKSKKEQKKLTKILMLTAYIPIGLITIPAANFIVCVIRQESLLIQEYVTCFVVPLIAVTFPLLTIVFVPALRVTAFQVLICTAWKANDDNGDSDINGNTAANTKGKTDDKDDNLSAAQVKALKDMAKIMLKPIFFLFFIVVSINGLKVVFFDNSNFRGNSFDFDSDDKGCQNTLANGGLNDKVTSVNTGGGCIILFENIDCQGNFIRVAPGCGINQGCCPNHANLGIDGCNFNDKASSFRVCS
ncbi:hypothetical protein FO519_002414 [Halicephalobus sp. NKZ332]|nr:hypothetical protein FO519_002414 [Halicephalobus sp. NKZ332]